MSGLGVRRPGFDALIDLDVERRQAARNHGMGPVGPLCDELELARRALGAAEAKLTAIRRLVDQAVAEGARHREGIDLQLISAADVLAILDGPNGERGEG
jgi:hypothetical protein